MTGSKVVELRPGIRVEDEARPVKSGERGPFCLHLRTELDGVARRVRCRDCKREVDAFEVLEALARDWERWIAGRDAAETRARGAEANLERILRLERNGKARLRSLRKKHEGDMVRVLRAALPLIDRRRPSGREVYSLGWRLIAVYDAQRDRDDG